MTDKEIQAAVSHFHNLTLEERKHKVWDWYDYTFAKWRLNGTPKVWVRRPQAVSIPAKHGLRTYAYFDENSVMLIGPEPLAAALRRAVMGSNRQRQALVERLARGIPINDS